ncbi:MAG: hypothetical protein RL584_1204 [Pseudomonadota bacterium]
MGGRSFLIRLGLFGALLACALMALAPTVVRAQAALQAHDPIWAALHEVCSAQGKLKAFSGEEGEPASAAQEDCRYCQTGTPGALPPPAGLVLALAPAALQAYPWLYWQAPEQLHAWLTPAPRGPPTHT